MRAIHTHRMGLPGAVPKAFPLGGKGGVRRPTQAGGRMRGRRPRRPVPVPPSRRGDLRSPVRSAPVGAGALDGPPSPYPRPVGAIARQISTRRGRRPRRPAVPALPPPHPRPVGAICDRSPDRGALQPGERSSPLRCGREMRIATSSLRFARLAVTDFCSALSLEKSRRLRSFSLAFFRHRRRRGNGSSQ